MTRGETTGIPLESPLKHPSVTFEEYIYYAKLEREREKSLPDTHQPVSSLKSVLFKKQTVVVDAPPSPPADEKDEKNQAAPSPIVTDGEWYHASRALRTATWGSVFYLITTDVLGPYSVPWALSQMGT